MPCFVHCAGFAITVQQYAELVNPLGLA